MNKEKKIKVLLCLNGDKDPNKPVLDRAGALLRYALESADIEYTYDYKEAFDLVHLLSVNQLKAYLSAPRKSKLSENVPVVVSLFNDPFDLRADIENDEEDYMKPLMKSIKPLEASVVTCPWTSEVLLLKHSNCFKSVQLLNIGAKTYFKKDYSQIELEAFRKYYRLSDDAKVILTIGEYDFSKGLAELEAVARILPEYEFFFFGSKSGNIVSNQKHYDKTNKINNLHYENYIPNELYHSAIFNADGAFFPYRFHTETVFTLELMKAGVPIVSNDNPILRDLLIDKKTAVIGRNVQDFYLALKSLKKVNYVSEALEFASNYTIEKYGQKIKDLYQGQLLLAGQANKQPD